MANLHDWFFRQRVSEGELDEGFEYLELADQNLCVDWDFPGIAQGMNVGEETVPSLNVEISAGTAYTNAGERIRIPGLQTVDVSVDENSNTTEPAVGGNSLVITIFAEFTRALSDPRVDGNSQVVYFNRFESFQFVVRKGNEAASPGGGAEVAFIQANAVANDPNLIRVCDIIRANGQTQIFNADIYENVLREDAFVLTAGTLSVRAGTAEQSDQANLQALSDHINDIANAHSADAVDFDAANLPIPAQWTALAAATEVQAAIDGIVTDLGQTDAAELIGAGVAATWADASGIAGATVDAILEEIVTDLGGGSGAPKIGLTPTATWENAEAITATDVFAYLEEIVGDLADNSGTSGSRRVGFDPASSSGPDLTATDVQSALGELDAGKGSLGNTNTWTGPTNTFNNAVALDGTTTVQTLRENDPSVSINTEGDTSNALGNERGGRLRGSANVTANAAAGAQQLLVIRSALNIDNDDFGHIMYVCTASDNGAGVGRSFTKVGFATWRDNTGTMNVADASLGTSTTGGGINGGNPTIAIANNGGALELQTTHPSCPGAQNVDYIWEIWEFKASAV